MEKIESKFKMYGLVPYHLSGEQKGIQFAHAVARYVYNYRDCDKLQKWVEVDETMVLLNGGTTNSDGSGTIQDHLSTLERLGVDVQKFHEPSLNNALTAICFLIPDYVWDSINFPFDNKHLTDEDVIKMYKKIGLDGLPKGDIGDDIMKSLDKVGGIEALELRLFIRKFRLA